jgi:hypothetical protein
MWPTSLIRLIRSILIALKLPEHVLPYEAAGIVERILRRWLGPIFTPTREHLLELVTLALEEMAKVYAGRPSAEDTDEDADDVDAPRPLSWTAQAEPIDIAQPQAEAVRSHAATSHAFGPPQAHASVLPLR